MIKELEKHFIGRGEVKGYEFAQINLNDRGFLYEVSISGTCTHYEVFERKINSMYQMVSYPRSNSFGIWAWTFKTLEKAIEKFNSL